MLPNPTDDELALANQAMSGCPCGKCTTVRIGITAVLAEIMNNETAGSVLNKWVQLAADAPAKVKAEQERIRRQHAELVAAHNASLQALQPTETDIAMAAAAHGPKH